MPRRDFTKVPFAATGDVTSIPTAVQPDGSVSMAAGFGFDYQRDNGAGGGTPDPLAKSIPRDATNGILNEITASIGEIQLNGLAIWAASAAPYPINATVRHNNTNWRSTVANNSAQPGVAPLDNWFDTTAQIAQATESVSGIAKIATSALALSGTDNATIITPLKLKNRLDAVVVQATTTVSGISRFGTQAEQLAGALSTVSSNPAGVLSQLTAMFPKRTFTSSDYIRIPDVPGGLIIQWGESAQIPANGTSTTRLPIAFPSSFLRGLAFYDGGTGGSTASTFSISKASNSQISIKNISTGASTPSYIAIGY